MTVGTEVLGWA